MIINPYAFAVTGGGADPTADANWLFNDGSGSTAADGSGNGKTLTLYNSPTWGTGPNSNGCVVLASNAYGDVAGDSAFANYTTGDFSICCWFNASVITNDPVLIFKGEFGANGYYVQLLTNGTVRYNAGSAQLDSSSGLITTATWYHFAVTKTGTAVKLYLDGAQVASGTVNEPASSSDDFQIGRYAAVSSLDFAGSIDDFRVYSSLKSGADISAIYSAGAQ